MGSKRAGDISEKGQQIAPAAQRVKEALVSQPSTTLRKFNASYTLEVITLNLGRKATSQNDSQLSFILHAVETKSAKDLYKRNEKVDFALIELSGFGTVTGGPGTYEEKIDRYWLRRTSQDDMLECCAYSVCAWTRQSTTVWVDHIDPHNQEAAISVMRFEAV